MPGDGLLITGASSRAGTGACSGRPGRGFGCGVSKAGRVHRPAPPGPWHLSISGKAHVRSRLRVRIGTDVDQGGFAALHRAFDRGFDFVGFFHVLAISTERFDHLVVTLVTEVTPYVAA